LRETRKAPKKPYMQKETVALTTNKACW